MLERVQTEIAPSFTVREVLGTREDAYDLMNGLIASINDGRPRRLRNGSEFVGELAPVSAIRRRLNQSPYIDAYVSRRALFYREKYDVAQAHDAVVIASVHNAAASLESYLQPRLVGSVSEERAELLVPALAIWTADVFDANYIVSPHQVARSLPRAYSTRLPFIGNKIGSRELKTCRQLWSSGTMEVMCTLTAQQVREGHFDPDVCHVFVKKYTVSERKMATPTAGIRAVTVAWLPSKLRDGMFTHHADKRLQKRWSDAPIKLGMPLNARGFNVALSQLAHHKRFISFDATAFDSTIPSDVCMKVVAKLRARGFDTHVVRDRIAEALKVSYTAVQQGPTRVPC